MSFWVQEGCSGRNERMPNHTHTERATEKRGFVQSLFTSLAYTSSCAGHFPSIWFYAGTPIWENWLFLKKSEITNSACCIFSPMRSSPIALSPCHPSLQHPSPHHPSLHPPFTSSPQCLFPLASQDKNMEIDPEKEQNKLIYVAFHQNLVG